MKFATQYNAGTRDTNFATMNELPTMTQQSDHDATNINIIVAKYMKGAPLPQVTEPGKFGDFTGISSFTDAMEMITKANEAFHEVPAHIRAKFNNNPSTFMEYIHDAKNIPELVKMGLATYTEIPDTSNGSPTTGEDNANTNTDGHRAHKSGPGKPGSQGLPEGSSHDGLRTSQPGGDQARGPGDGQRGDPGAR